MGKRIRLATASSGRPGETVTRLEISKTGVTWLLVVCVVVLHLLNIPVLIFRYVWQVEWARQYIMFFGVSGEGKLPTFYSGVTLFAAAVLLGLIAAHERLRAGRFQLHWAALAVIFTLMSMDETVAIHELSTGTLRRYLGITGGLLYSAWVIPAMVFLAFMAFAYFRFLLALPARSRVLFVVAGTIYVGGALVMEMFDSAYAAAYGHNLTYGVLATLEEVGEMSGIVVFLYGLMDHLERTAPESHIRFVD